MAETKRSLEAAGIAPPLSIDRPDAPAIAATPAVERGAAVLPLVLSALEVGWYQRQLGPEARENLGSGINVPENLANHYLEEGARKGLSPARTFSTLYYRARSAEPLSDDVNPLVDYLNRGRNPAAAPHPLLKQGAPLAVTEAMTEYASPLFDPESYLDRNPDVAAAGLDPLYLFFNWGMEEGRTPHILFDPKYYRSQLGATENDIDPFAHYVAVGWMKGYSPHPDYDLGNAAEAKAQGLSPIELSGLKVAEPEPLASEPTPAMAVLSQQRRNVGSPATKAKSIESEAQSSAVAPKGFRWNSPAAVRELLRTIISPAWYLRQCDPIARRGLQSSVNQLDSLVEHYLSVGSAEGMSPIYSFSTSFFRALYGDALNAADEPLINYLRSGRVSQRRPHPLLREGASLAVGPGMLVQSSPLFDGAIYLKRYPDVEREGLDPLYHFFNWGLQEGRSPHALFDVSFYLSQIEDTRLPADPFVHYLTKGWKLGLRPHPLFDVDYYTATVGHLSGLSPLEHYTLIGAKERRSIHPLFDVDFYLTQVDSAARTMDPIVHFVVSGSKGDIDPHPLFDTRFARDVGGFDGPAGPFLAFIADPFGGSATHPLFQIGYYRAQTAKQGRAIGNPLLDYLNYGKREGLSPHPLFDPVHYAKQSEAAAASETPLLHYLAEGSALGHSPHPLFEPEAFRASVPLERREAAGLSDYLRSPAGTRPHHLFDEDHFQAALPARSKLPGLELYVTEPAFAKTPTHPLFEPSYYCSNAAKYLGDLDWQVKGEARKALRADLDPKVVERLPLLHYTQCGWRYGLSTARSFDVQHYRLQSGIGPGVDPMRHYLLEGGMALYSPHPALDLEHYRRNAVGFDPKVKPIFLHILETPFSDRASASTALDRKFYVESNTDISKYNLCPTEHFVNYGMNEGRRPNYFYSSRHINSKFRDEIVYNKTPMWEYFSRSCGRRAPRVLFVGHDASRTGAPLILLRLIEGMNSRFDIDAYSILGSGGSLYDEFSAASHCHVMSNGLGRPFLDGGDHTVEWLTEMEKVTNLFGPKGPDIVICNTAETRAFAEYFGKRKVPVFSLVHESADFYDSAQLEIIYCNSAAIIFPSQYTRARAELKTPLDERPALVRGQGLLDPSFGTLGRGPARADVLKQLRLPQDARIVLGCGTADIRKGIDLFVETAVQILTDPATKDDRLYFVWVGGGKTYQGPDAWARRRVAESELDSRIIFAGEKADTEPFYRASDVLLMTSRMDPFPCVIHEAMASALPIIAFEGCSGAPEAFLDSGLVVPAEDTAAMASALGGLLADETKRQRLGERAKSIVAEKWVFADYVEDIAEIIGARSGLKLLHRGGHQAPAVMPGSAAQRGPIYFSSPDWGISGVNTFTYNLVQGLNERGYDARILFTNGRFGTMPSPDMMPDLPVTFLPLEGHHFMTVWHTLARFLKDKRPCIYVPNYDYVASAISPIIHPNVGVVGIAHSDDVEHYEHVDRLGRYWDRIVAVSKFIESEIGDLNPKFVDKTRTIYYGVPFDEAAARARVNTRNYAKDDPLVLTYTGRMVVQQKNIFAYAALAERLREAGVPFKLNLLGDGEQYDQLRWKMGGLVDTGVVNMPGRVTPAQVAKELEDTDIFVLLSDFEGLPLSMLEAMALGVIPVIRDMKSGIPEVIETGKNGFITARSDLDAMVEVLKELQENPDRRRALGHAVIDSFIEHRLGKSDMVDAYADLFDEVFAELQDRPLPRAMPLAYNAPVYGVAAPPFLYRRD